MPEYAHYFLVFCRERGNRGLSGGAQSFRTLRRLREKTLGRQRLEPNDPLIKSSLSDHTTSTHPDLSRIKSTKKR